MQGRRVGVDRDRRVVAAEMDDRVVVDDLAGVEHGGEVGESEGDEVVAVTADDDLLTGFGGRFGGP